MGQLHYLLGKILENVAFLTEDGKKRQIRLEEIENLIDRNYNYQQEQIESQNKQLDMILENVAFLTEDGKKRKIRLEEIENLQNDTKMQNEVRLR